MYTCFPTVPSQFLEFVNFDEQPQQIEMQEIEEIEVDGIEDNVNSEYKQILLVKLRGEIEYYTSYGDDNFFECSERSERPEQNPMVNDFLIKWIENRIPKYSLYCELSKLSQKRGKEHSPEWFIDHLSSVRLRYINKELVPFRYTVKTN